MPTTLPTPLRLILPAVQAQLSRGTGLGLNLILLLSRQRAQAPHFQGDQDCLVLVGPPHPESGFEVGSGRVATVVTRVLEVCPRTRLAVDQSDRDDLWLTDPTYGELGLEDRVLDCLHVWAPTDTRGNWLTVEPLLWVPGPPPGREEPLMASWGLSPLLFTCRYQQVLPSPTF